MTIPSLWRKQIMTAHVAQVGAPDPERATSPIFDGVEAFSRDLVMEAGAGYFNDVSYPLGRYLRSGSGLLHCEERGIWVRKGEVRPD
jgi:hypothetical protein